MTWTGDRILTKWAQACKHDSRAFVPAPWVSSLLSIPAFAGMTQSRAGTTGTSVIPAEA